MKDKTIAVAVAAALFPAVALADASTVTIYGTVHAGFENVAAHGARIGANSIVGRNRVSSNLTHIGFRGSEPVGGGMNAFFQVESLVPIDAGGGTWASRNSGVGLNGGFGTLLYGFWDTPFKLANGSIDPWGVNIGDAATVLHNHTALGSSAIGSASQCLSAANNLQRGTFHRRQHNSVQYWTPPLGGFFARLGYGANEERTSSCNPWLGSVSVGFNRAPFYVAAAYEHHNDFGTAAGLDDKAWKVAASYTIANQTFSVGYTEQEYEYRQTALGTAPCGSIGECDLRIPAWLVSGVHRFGPHTLRWSYLRAKDPKGGARASIGNVDTTTSRDAGADMWTVGYGYNLSRRTDVYVLWAKIKNDPFANYDFSVNNVGVSGTTGASSRHGADPRGYGVHVRHTF